jgi:hypothetical protein
MTSTLVSAVSQPGTFQVFMAAVRYTAGKRDCLFVSIPFISLGRNCERHRSCMMGSIVWNRNNDSFGSVKSTLENCTIRRQTKSI